MLIPSSRASHPADEKPWFRLWLAKLLRIAHQCKRKKQTSRTSARVLACSWDAKFSMHQQFAVYFYNVTNVPANAWGCEMLCSSSTRGVQFFG
jgi:hypothetical protein